MTEVTYTSISKLSDIWHIDAKAVPGILEKAGVHVLVITIGRTGMSRQVSSVELINKKESIERELVRYRESVSRQRSRAVLAMREARGERTESIERLLTEQCQLLRETNEQLKRLADVWCAGRPAPASAKP